MTAEVAIMNKGAIALAADSAVTTGGPKGEKIFNGANKIFTLSKYSPVGIMIYGHVEHCGVPWETIIKTFRNEIGDKKLDSVKDYVEEFKIFISSAHLFTERQQKLSVMAACVFTLSSLHEEFRMQESGSRAERLAVAIESMNAKIDGTDKIDGYEDYSYQSFCVEYKDLIDSFIEENPMDHIVIPRRFRAKVRKTVFNYISRKYYSIHSTGIVICGFGEKELFPTLFHLRVDGGVGNRIRILEKDPIDISRTDETVYVEAFAQEDAVDAFMNGVDQNYSIYSRGLLSGFVMSHTEQILDDHTQMTDDEKLVTLAMVERSLPSALRELDSHLRYFSNERFTSPIEDVLRFAPKDELAHVAESFVNLTSLKRRVSGDPETVGGAIDVAVISKGDGFVWIKRKHYFQPELNQQFFNNYFGR